MTDPTPGLPRIGLVLHAHAGRPSWLASALEIRGHALIHVEGRADVRDRIRTDDPDLILVDAALPSGEALILAHELLEAADPERPVVIVSEVAISTEARLEMLRAGIWECVAATAPEAQEEVLLRIESYLRSRRAMSRDRLGMLIDPVTGLYNRIGLSRRSRELGAHLFRNHEPVACVVFGLTLEPDSDTALATCVRLLRHEGRLSDVIARLGDREIVFVAPRTDDEGAKHLAERIERLFRSSLARGEHPEVLLDIQAVYESAPSSGYAPVQPIDLVIRSALALKAKDGASVSSWLRRSGGEPRPLAALH